MGDRPFDDERQIEIQNIMTDEMIQGFAQYPGGLEPRIFERFQLIERSDGG